MSVFEKVITEILPKAAEDGNFGPNILKFVEFKTDKDYAAKDQFSSSIFFGDVIFETKNGSHEALSIVVKAQAGGKLFEKANNCSLNIQLYNEFLFYTEILPLLRQCDPTGSLSNIFPRCFYAHANEDNPVEDILIFENVQKQGFRLSPWRAFNDYTRIELAVKLLGKFHAMSLVCKKKFPEKFHQAITKFKETHWTKKRLNNPDDVYKENCKRGTQPLQNDPIYKNKLKDLLTIIEMVDLSMAKIVAPNEPLAVVCHGDFCRNNFFYKYDSNSKPTEIMFFDFATSRYSSPVIDLSFYLFMNSSPEFKTYHWNDILQTYHTALTSNPNLDRAVTPSFEDIQLEVRRRGFYGYTHAAFFLPAMLGEFVSNDDFHEMTMPEIIKRLLSYGGEAGTEYVKQLVKHMIDHDFDFKYILDLNVEALSEGPVIQTR